MPGIKTIMLIDDDPDDRLLFCEALTQVDKFCHCMTANDGEQALKMLRTTDITLPDLIFLDLNMPRMNGWQCLSQLLKINDLKSIPVIIYSTSQEEGDLRKAKQAGAAYFFTKPARFADLVHGIFYVLNNKWEEVAKLNDVKYKK